MGTTGGKLTDKDLTEKYRTLVQDPFTVHDVTRVNHKPHPFMIGGRHVSEAADHHGGMLTEEVCRKIPCAWSGCYQTYDQHTSDHVLFLKVTRHCTNQEASRALFALKEPMLADGLDGVAFIKTEFDIAPPTPADEARES